VVLLCPGYVILEIPLEIRHSSVNVVSGNFRGNKAFRAHGGARKYTFSRDPPRSANHYTQCALRQRLRRTTFSANERAPVTSFPWWHLATRGALQAWRHEHARCPNFADAHVDVAFIDSMAAITPLVGLGMLPDLKRELPLYLAAASNASALDKSDVTTYTDSLLKWWRVNGTSFPSWAKAARIAFALSPNSASCERVFALLKETFGEDQLSALADQLRAALMLAYNKRRVG
jgi:hypothetical protein